MGSWKPSDAPSILGAFQHQGGKMFTVYAVMIVKGEKNRFMIGSKETLEEAKHLANCAVCGSADYAYVKDFGDGTVFFIRPPSYDEQPLLRQQNPLLVDPALEESHRQKYRQYAP